MPLKSKHKQQQYKSNNEACELTPWLQRNIPRLCDTRDYSLHLHHIVFAACRYDFHTNFIVISKTVHDWIHLRDTVSGSVLAVWKKVQKNEFDFDEFHKCAGRPLWNWLQSYEPKEPLIVPLWNELEAYSRENRR